MKKIISFVVVLACLLSSLAVNVYAVNGNLDFYADDLSYYAEYYDSQNGNFVSLPVTKSIVTFNNIEALKLVTPVGNDTRFVDVYNIESLKADHEYSISFSYAYNYASNARFNLNLQVLNGNGTVIDSQILYSASGGTNNTWYSVNLNFVPDLSNVTTGYTMRILFEYVQTSNSGNWTTYLSNYIYFNDNDDDSGWFESIIQWLQNVRDSVSNIGSNIVSALSNLGTNISSWLTNVKDGIVNKLSDVITGINNKLESVKISIQNSIDNIQNWFISLGDRISDFFTMLKNYLLYFRHPVTINADGIPVDSSGNPVYTNPFESALNSVKSQFDEWIDNINDFIDSIDDSADTFSTQLSTFKTIFNRFNSAIPFFGSLCLFIVIFFVIRKIIGR